MRLREWTILHVFQHRRIVLFINLHKVCYPTHLHPPKNPKGHRFQPCYHKKTCLVCSIWEEYIDASWNRTTAQAPCLTCSIWEKYMDASWNHTSAKGLPLTLTLLSQDNWSANTKSAVLFLLKAFRQATGWPEMEQKIKSTPVISSC